MGIIAMYRWSWEKANYYAQMLYWLTGREDTARFLGKIPVIQRARQDVFDVHSRVIADLENVRALAVYLGKPGVVAPLQKEVSRINALVQDADRIYTHFKLAEALSQYAKALAASRDLADRTEVAGKSLKNEAAAGKKLTPIIVKSGKPASVGPHGNGVSYCSGFNSNHGVREHAIKRMMEQMEIVGFNSLAGHVSMVYFVKRKADATTVDDEDLNLWVYDDLIRACKDKGWNAFISVDPSDYFGWTGGDYSYFHKGVPLVAKPYEVSKGRFRYSPNYTSELFLSRRQAVLEKVVEYYKNTPEVVGYDVDNESSPGMMQFAGPVAEFRKWLAKKYKTVASLNRVHRSSYRDFDTIVPPAFELLRKHGMGPKARRAMWHEWRQFEDDVYVNHFRRDYETIKRISPDKYVRDRLSELTTAGMPNTIASRARAPYYRLTKHLDVGGVHIWSLYSLDQMRAQCNKATPGLSEYYMLGVDGPYDFKGTLHRGPDGQWAMPKLSSENVNMAAAARNFWTCISRGVRTFHIHAPGGAGVEVYNMYAPSHVTWRRQMFGLKYAAKEFARVAGELDGAKAVSQVALMEMPESIAQEAGSEIQTDVMFSARDQVAIFNTLYSSLDIQSDPIGPNNPDISKYPVLIVPQGIFMNKQHADMLEKYVRAGGRLILSGPAGVYDQYAFKSGDFLKRVCGVEVTGRGPAKAVVFAAAGKLRAKFTSPKAHRWQIKAAGAKVIAKFADGSPAIVSRKVGKGTVVVSAYGFSQTDKTSAELKQLVKPYVNLPAVTDRPAHLYFVERDGKSLVYVINRDVKPVSTSVRFKRPYNIEDIRAGVRMRAAKVPMQLGPGEVRILRFWR